MVGIDSSNIQTALKAINPTKVETTQLSNSIAGNQNASTDKIDLPNLTLALNDLAIGNLEQKATFANIVDLMSKEKGGKDEFFTKEGLIAFRKALIQQGTPLDAKKVSAAFDASKQKYSVNGEAAVGVEDLTSNDVAIDSHLRSMIGMKGDGNTGTAMGESEPATSEVKLPDAAGLLDSNLLPHVQDKLAQIFGKIDDPNDKEKIKAYRNSDDYAKKVRAMTVNMATTNINDLVGKASLGSEVMQAIKDAVNTHIAEVDAAKGLFGGYDWVKVNASKAKLADKLSANPTVKQSMWGQHLAAIKNISPKFYMLILNEERNPVDSSNGYPQEASWVINMIYSNGVSNSQTGGIPKDAIVKGGYDGVKYAEALESFLTFASQGNDQAFKFYSKEEIANNQNIYDGGNSSDFWKQNSSVRALWQRMYPDITSDKDLMNKYLEDMRRAGYIKIDDMHNYLFKRHEGKKLEAIAQSIANMIEAKYCKGNDKVKEGVGIADIFTIDFSKKVIAERNRIYSTESADLKENVSVADVLGSLQFASKGGVIPTSAEVAQLMEGYYGKVLSNNEWSSSTQGEDVSVVTKRIQAGLEYLKKPDNKLTLYEAMNGAGEPPVAEPAGTVGAGRAGGQPPRMTPEEQKKIDDLPEPQRSQVRAALQQQRAAQPGPTPGE